MIVVRYLEFVNFFNLWWSYVSKDEIDTFGGQEYDIGVYIWCFHFDNCVSVIIVIFPKTNCNEYLIIARYLESFLNFFLWYSCVNSYKFYPFNAKWWVSLLYIYKIVYLCSKLTFMIQGSKNNLTKHNCISYHYFLFL